VRLTGAATAHATAAPVQAADVIRKTCPYRVPVYC
jgi:hypothetical protein